MFIKARSRCWENTEQTRFKRLLVSIQSCWLLLGIKCRVAKVAAGEPEYASFQPPMCDTRAVIKRILVRCPVTKKLNVTGVVIEEDAFVATDLKPGRVACSHCGETHSWNKKEVILAR